MVAYVHAHDAYALSTPHQRIPLLVSSPHSGTHYPADFKPAADINAIRQREDSHVDALFSRAPSLKAHFITAHIGPAYINLNRAISSLDPRDFENGLTTLPWNKNDPYTPSGHGLIATRTLYSGEAIYDRPLIEQEVRARLDYYSAYHNEVADQLTALIHEFGHAVLIDAHSFPSAGLSTHLNSDAPLADFIIGDVHGRTAHPDLVAAITAPIKAQGYNVSLNEPYFGGHITKSYGAWGDVQAVQIEIRRDLYMNEQTREQHKGVYHVKETVDAVLEAAAQYAATFKPR